jgi:hypothetical protein
MLEENMCGFGWMILRNGRGGFGPAAGNMVLGKLLKSFLKNAEFCKRGYSRIPQCEQLVEIDSLGFL